MHNNKLRLATIVVALTVVLTACFGCSSQTTTDTTSTTSSTDSSISTQAISSEVYAELLTKVEYGSDTVYVIGHKSPDTDTVCSAIAYANLLQELGIKAEARVSGELNNETKYVLEKAGIEVPEVLESAKDKSIILVDHSKFSQAIDGMDEANVLGIVDHHSMGADIQTEEVAYTMFKPAGCTASLIYMMYKECNVSIAKDMATVMFSAIESDTSNMESNTVTSVDKLAYDELSDTAEISDIGTFYSEMSTARCNYDGMSDKAIYLSDYKEYETNNKTYGIGCVPVKEESDIEAMETQMEAFLKKYYKKQKMDMLFLMVKDSTGETTHILAYDSKSQAVLKEAYKDDIDGAKVVLDGDVQRKTITPEIDNVLNED